MFASIIRTVIMYFLVTVALRIMGKRQIGDMQPGELVITLLMSEIAAIPIQDATQPLLNGAIAIFFLVVVEICVSVLALKCFTVGKVFGGKEAVIIKNGTVDQKAMARVRVTVMDLIELLRKQGVFDISKVDYAVLEVDGNLSVLLKAQDEPLTPKALAGFQKGDKSREGMPVPVISDGVLIEESLVSLKIKKQQVFNLLKANNATVKDVFLLTLDRYGNNNLILKEQ